MIKVSIAKDYSLIVMEGHAEFAEYGKDILCASVSSILITSINACLSIDNESIVYTVDDNDELIIRVEKTSDITTILLTNMINMLKELESQYPENIKIRNEG